MHLSNYPLVMRPRRLRESPALRKLVRENSISTHDLIAPLFVTDSTSREPVASMPGTYRIPVQETVDEARKLMDVGISAIILFGIPASRDTSGSQAYAEDGVVQRALRVLKAAHPSLLLITDVCLCEYTDHGHCGLTGSNGQPDNDATLPVLGRIAASHAAAGADVVAPSAMMDGMVGAIRRALDSTGHHSTPILAYSVKYASSLYGPFREAAASALLSGDRRSHQMDPANGREALRESDLDVAEGADMLMVKPALSCLDIVSQLRTRHPSLPLVAYQVSGEFCMLKAASLNGWLDERDAVLETLVSMKRAGADAIITYYAGDVARWLSDEAS